MQNFKMETLYTMSGVVEQLGNMDFNLMTEKTVILKEESIACFLGPAWTVWRMVIATKTTMETKKKPTWYYSWCECIHVGTVRSKPSSLTPSSEGPASSSCVCERSASSSQPPPLVDQPDPPQFMTGNLSVWDEDRDGDEDMGVDVVHGEDVDMVQGLVMGRELGGGEGR